MNLFEIMENLLKTSLIKGLVFGIYGEMGPQPLYCFPNSMKQEDIEKLTKKDLKKGILHLTHRDYTQIAIKNLSLLIGDGTILNRVDIQNFQYFGIVPFPDFRLTSLTYFHFVKTNLSEIPLASSFSILVDENRRSFLYNNIERLKAEILAFFKRFDIKLVDEYPVQEEVQPFFERFLQKIILIERSPSTPFTTHRKMKILFAGLDDSGKTSFLLSVNRKYSKLIGLSPTKGAEVTSIEALGATIFLWDLGGQLSLRKKYLGKAQIYLYEADLLFYFIDITNKRRFEESIEYLDRIRENLNKLGQNTPIVYILSKGDSDVLDTSEVRGNISRIKKLLIKRTPNGEPGIYITSIFEIFTILRAFSYGIAKLSPNRDLIKHKLESFAKSSNVYLTLLLTNEGLVLADQFTSKALALTRMPKSEELISVFEITAPQFAILFKIFSKYRNVKKDEAIFKVANSVILFKKFRVEDYDMFLLFLIDDEDKKEKISKHLPMFLEQTQDLLLRFIS